ncbi:MAG: hypothetical protein MZV49_20120 [Rhodopseudomonas palustris]|nr:hypothetical protein [Rhodopseudomonas palustris]
MNVNLGRSRAAQGRQIRQCLTSEGPWKEKIEELFRDDPDLAKELKEISALNALKAAQTALDLYNKEKERRAASSSPRPGRATTSALDEHPDAVGCDLAAGRQAALGRGRLHRHDH